MITNIMTLAIYRAVLARADRRLGGRSIEGAVVGDVRACVYQMHDLYKV